MNSTDRPLNPVAYKNEGFLDSDDARLLPILAEYLKPMHAFQRERDCDTIVLFGPARLASDGPLGHYYDAARGYCQVEDLIGEASDLRTCALALHIESPRFHTQIAVAPIMPVISDQDANRPAINVR